MSTLNADISPLACDNVSAFASEIFSPMPRMDQRRWAEVYLRGLLMVDGKKSVRRIAESLPIFQAKQSLQQFINQSPWDWEPVRALLARHAEASRRPQAWSVERVVIPKRGERSVGVQKRFVPELGRTVNSQLGLGVVLTSDTMSVPVDWRIALHGKWREEAAFRRSAYIPENVYGKPEWAEITDMLEEMGTRWHLSPAPVIGNLRHLPDAARLVNWLTARGIDYAVEVDASFPVTKGDAAAYPARPVTNARDVLRDATGSVAQRGAGALSLTRARRGRLISQYVRVPTAARLVKSPPQQPVRLIGEITAAQEPTRFWLTNVTGGLLEEVMPLVSLSARSRAGMQRLETHFGLRDFEGRSFRGWHHHMTMVSTAAAYSALREAAAHPGPLAAAGAHRDLSA
ncbi:IS701 family transposase [Streptomyces rubradiris]